MLRKAGISLFRFLASLKLAVILLAFFAAILSTATIVESRYGADYARWYIYQSSWFIGFLALLGTNIFCAAAIRFPWKRHQAGFVVTHAGLLVLLAGSIVTFIGGIEGRVSVVEGDSTKTMTVAGKSQLNAFWVGRPDEPPYEFTFDPGPKNWTSGRVLDVGEVDGVRTRILGYLHTPRAVEAWVPDEARIGGPAVKFHVAGKDGVAVADSWLVDYQFGDAVFLGPLRLQLERAAADSMLTDFLSPPTGDMGEKGILAMYFEGEAKRVSIGEHLAKRIPLGTDGAAVEIQSYLPNAKPDPRGNFASKDDQPKNPMVELRVYLPGEDRPLRQIAFAKDPLLNLDGVYSRVCPVKFRFHHPVVQPRNGLELLQTSNGKLYGRLCNAGTYESRGELKAGDKIMMPGNFEFEIVEHLPHATQRITYEMDATAKANKVEPAALVEISAAGTTQQVWMRRNDPNFGQRSIVTPNGTLALSYEHAQIPLGFSIKLVDFRRETNPGKSGNASFASHVQITDPARDTFMNRRIAMNEPLTHQKFTFYQSGFEDAMRSRETSSFNVAYDPGRTLKYFGSFLICLGIAIMFYMRAYVFKKSKPTPSQVTSVERTATENIQHDEKLDAA